MVAAGLALKPGYDWFFPVLPRSRAVPRARHDAARDVPVGRRRQGRPEQRRPADAVALGPQGAQHRLAVEPDRHAVPARRRLRRSRHALRAAHGHPRSRVASSRRTKSSTSRIGDGTTSEGEFWESLSTACVRKLPVVFMIEDNGYAISVPVEVQTPGGDISQARRVVPGPEGRCACDGTDVLESYRAMTEAVALLPRAQGPRARPRQGRPAVLALAVGRRAAVQDGGGARGRSDARSDHEVRGGAQGAGPRDGRRPRRDRQGRRSRGRRGRRRAPSRRRSRRRTPPVSGCYSPDVDPTSAAFDTPVAAEGKPDTMVVRDQPHDEGRDGASTRASSCSARTWRTPRTSRT